MGDSKTGLCWVFSIFFLAAGLQHFAKVDGFVTVLPPIFPFPKTIVWIAGVMELVLAVGLALPKHRKRADFFWLAPYLLAVLPANMYMAMNNIPLGQITVSPMALWGGLRCNFP